MRKLSGSWRRDVWDRVSFVREFREARAVAKLVSTSEKKGTAGSQKSGFKSESNIRRHRWSRTHGTHKNRMRKVHTKQNETFQLI